ncbi:MAG: ferredoxin family protein [Desulfobacteraceae bacterium]|jgi:NAD-dependent dihydropyrimidine dehydrogenase PreA subunit
MSVQRYDLNACLGCKKCYYICPMDVFRFDKVKKKSVIAYPENCQSCGQCYLNCLGHSLIIVNDMFGYASSGKQPKVTYP